MAVYCEKLCNMDNYLVFQDLARTGYQVIYTKDINSETHLSYFNGLMNILRDGIEEESVQKMIINVVWEDGQQLELNIMDLYFNLVMWRSMVDLAVPIEPWHLFDPDDITQDDIKSYIDNRFLIAYRDEYNVLYERGYDPETSNIILNQCIDNGVYGFSFIDEFAMYLMNTINIEDDINLCKENPKFYELLHHDFSNVAIENIKDETMKVTREIMSIIKNSDHCLSDSFRSKEGVNPKQYREYESCIGTKQDGKGSAFPTMIPNSFINGGVNTTESFFIESYSGRLAQIIAKCNVGTSGAFARILGLNNRDSYLHPNPKYVCDSRNFEQIIIKDASYLYTFEGRYYRTHPLGIEKCLTVKDTHLVGKMLYFRSPMKCASAARGEGICHRCYGKLAATNASINIGQFAAEALSSKLTQKQLSAKHLLESSIVALEWCEDFDKFFEVEFNAIVLKEDTDYSNLKLIIDPKDIKLESEEDDYDYNEFINSFEVIDEDNNSYLIYTKNNDPIYISNELNDIIRKLNRDAVEGDKLSIPLEKLGNDPVFMMNLMNNEFSATLERIKTTINLEAVTTSFDTHQLLQEFIAAVKDGGLGVNAVHLEVILMNQLRNKDDILLTPDWTVQNEECQVITLNHALTNNPSITVSLMYRVSNTYYNPLSFKKHKASFLDLLFMEKPQFVFQNDGLYQPKNPKQDFFEKRPLKIVDWADK